MNTSQSVQKEEIRKEYEALRGEIKLTSVEKWLDSIVDRISASVREETLKEAMELAESQKSVLVKEGNCGRDRKYRECESCSEMRTRNRVLNKFISALQKLSD